MTQRPTPPPDLSTYPESHTPLGMTEARDGGARTVPQARTPAPATHPLRSASGHFYEFQIASRGALFHVELLRLTVGFFGRVRRNCAGVTDGPFDTRADAEAALTRRWDNHWRATEASQSVE